MTLLTFLTTWANAPFTVVGAITVLFALLSISGVMGLLAGGDHGDGHDVDADADVDADVDADADADPGHDADHDADHDAEGEGDGGRSLGAMVLGPMGLGRLPLSLMWQSFAIVFALTGLTLNSHYAALGAVPLLTLAWTVPASTAVGYAFVALLAKLLGPVFSTKEVEATSRAQLVGQMGVVISSKVTSSFGEVRIHDKSGHDIRVICKLMKDSREPKEHESVVVVEFDEEKGELYVAPLEESEEGARPRIAGSEPPEPPDEDHAGASGTLDKRHTAP